MALSPSLPSNHTSVEMRHPLGTSSTETILPLDINASPNTTGLMLDNPAQHIDVPLS